MINLSDYTFYWFANPDSCGDGGSGGKGGYKGRIKQAGGGGFGSVADAHRNDETMERDEGKGGGVT